MFSHSHLYLIVSNRLRTILHPLIFRSVTHLELHDKLPFKHEFFILITQAFSSLKLLSIMNIRSQF